MSIKEQTEKELADAGRMLAEQLSTIGAELSKRGVTVEYGQNYTTGALSVEYKRVTEAKI